ncbi:MAG: phosphate/phosphite/phosphonate ABC transporter substrate-binding protein [Myxococcales bacterium]|nr:phosphate/phosphite/phosphonate ABC transporter substrate-binding protein [Myxococcales bacterium]
MRKWILATVAVGAAAASLLAMSTHDVESQPSRDPGRLTVGIYAPTVEFATAQARLAYIQGLAKAIESNTGIKTEGQSFASLSALRQSGVDFAILDGQCYAVNSGYKLIAVAEIGGDTTRSWGLFSSVGTDMQSLRGKKLSYVQTGCNDGGFIDHAMLESEVDGSFFSGRVGKGDLVAAVAEVASYKGAQAVFAPSGSQKGLTKVFDTGAVPNPAFVALGDVDSSLTAKVAAAVTGYGGSGAISGWSAGGKQLFQALSGRMSRSSKAGVFAAPEAVRFDAKDVLVEPATLSDTDLTPIRQHFIRPKGRME